MSQKPKTITLIGDATSEILSSVARLDLDAKRIGKLLSLIDFAKGVKALQDQFCDICYWDGVDLYALSAASIEAGEVVSCEWRMLGDATLTDDEELSSEGCRLMVDENRIIWRFYWKGTDETVFTPELSRGELLTYLGELDFDPADVPHRYIDALCSHCNEPRDEHDSRCADGHIMGE